MTYGHDGGNGYHELEGDWASYYKVARYFVCKVKKEDRPDFLHDLLLEMAKVKRKYEAKGKPLVEAGLRRVAGYEVADYWERQMLPVHGNCSRKQRRRCREENVYQQCPKARHLVSLNKGIGDPDGKPIELWRVIADDNTVDFDAWLEASCILQDLSPRLVQIGYKRYAGYRLTQAENKYLLKQRKRLQQRGERRTLTDIDRLGKIIEMHHQGYTHKAIGDYWGVSRRRIGYILAEAPKAEVQ